MLLIPMVSELTIEVAVKHASMALIWSLFNNILDMFKDQGLILWVANRSMMMEMGNEMFAKTSNRDIGIAATALVIIENDKNSRY